MHCSSSKQGDVTHTAIGAFCRCVPLDTTPQPWCSAITVVMTKRDGGTLKWSEEDFLVLPGPGRGKGRAHGEVSGARMPLDRDAREDLSSPGQWLLESVPINTLSAYSL